MIKRILLLLLAAVCLLSGCALPTVELYCLPKRPQSYSDLQEVFDSAMVGLEYSAPRAGQNQQTVNTGFRRRSIAGRPVQEVIRQLVGSVGVNKGSHVFRQGEGVCFLLAEEFFIPRRHVVIVENQQPPERVAGHTVHKVRQRSVSSGKAQALVQGIVLSKESTREAHQW